MLMAGLPPSLEAVRLVPFNRSGCEHRLGQLLVGPDLLALATPFDAVVDPRRTLPSYIQRSTS